MDKRTHIKDIIILNKSGVSMSVCGLLEDPFRVFYAPTVKATCKKCAEKLRRYYR
jgi:hypothetical protein